MLKKSTILFFFVLNLFCVAIAQKAPKRELRAVWVATVFRIDWPNKKKPEKQKTEFIDMLDEFVSIGFNTIIVQVRSSADAFYASPYEPWSQWLTGKQGVAPDPMYDPLEFIIEEAHKRNLEIHAWFNPFRAVLDTTKTKTDSLHISKTHPEWLFAHGKNLYLNPGIPEAREYVVKVVTDVANRYDIDGVHFDDYFYPYPIKGVAIPDSAQYQKYNSIASLTIDDWRRNNVNTFVREMHNNLLITKPYLKFGISPFGIWRNKRDDINGSATRGLSNYDALYADVRKWLQEGWLDYAAPQLYWTRGYKIADFDTLAKWWDENSFGRHIYTGHAAFRISKKAKQSAWKKPDEVPSQLRDIREKQNLSGSIFYSSKSVLQNPLGLTDSLKEDLYKYPAFVPTMSWKDATPPPSPTDFRSERNMNKIVLTWEKPTVSNPSPVDSATYYAVYKFRGTEIGDISNPANIYAITRDNQISFTRRWAVFRKKYTYTVTAFDRMHNESNTAQAVIVKQKSGK